MTWRIFISYQHRDQMRAKGFNLMSYNKNLDLEFVGRHLLDPVDSSNEDYIRTKIREQITGSSVTVVIIGAGTADSDWVAREIDWSLDKNPPNGILGIKLTPDARVPERLDACGAEILDWFEPDDVHEFQDAIKRARDAAGRAANMPTNSESTCAR
jgi:hypothetical protein